jgi:hypothetical protein
MPGDATGEVGSRDIQTDELGLPMGKGKNKADKSGAPDQALDTAKSARKVKGKRRRKRKFAGLVGLIAAGVALRARGKSGGSS